MCLKVRSGLLMCDGELVEELISLLPGASRVGDFLPHRVSSVRGEAHAE